MTCPDCGATNPKDAAWCSLCARSFASSVITAPDPEPSHPEPSHPEVGGDAPRPAEGWTCRSCATGNPLTENVCSVCGTSIFDSFGRSDQASADRDAAAGRAWVPGWGHATLGDQGTAAMVVATVVVGLVLGTLLVLAPDTVFAGIVCLVAALGTWGAAATDVTRRASGGSAFLTGRRLLWVALGIVVVALGAFVGAIDG